jgi:CHAT domain-containing protein
LPLHALPWPGYDQRLLDGYTVSYNTTADVLVLSTRKEASPAGTVALAPGLPEGPDGSPLFGSLAEASAVTAKANGHLLLGKRATVDALLKEHVAAGARWVLLATHGRAGRRDATRAGLLFYNAEGTDAVWLTAAEILGRLDLIGVEHLGLAACSTHADDPAAGDRLAGLLRALLYRGARSVQATLWPVRDDAATLVSVWTWEALLDGERDKARALRQAIQRLRRCTGAEAATELRRIAASVPLPADDPAHTQLEGMASELAEQGSRRPFQFSTIWAPFVLHGAPDIAVGQATDVMHNAR